MREKFSPLTEDRPSTRFLPQERRFLYLHQSNRLEPLFAQFRALIADAPGDPLVAETVVVHNPGMAQWLSRQLALSEGIAANFRFPLPARLIWDLYQATGEVPPPQDRFSRSVLAWRVAGILPRFAAHTLFGEIRGYLQDDDDGVKRYQLAGQISEVFDQYLIYRPDLLDRWENEERPQHWQAVLWRELAAGGQPHRARLLDRLRTALLQGTIDRQALPPRLHLFGINALAPIHLELFVLMGRHTEVHLFHQSPCRHFWGDLKSARFQARRRAGTGLPDPGPSTLPEEGNPLLLSLGRTGQDFFRQLLDHQLQELDLYVEPEACSILAALQADILDLVDRSADAAPPLTLAADDRSLQFHVCSSRLREVQILHDRLLELFDRLPQLRPDDILVCAPDIGRYAEAVIGVFGEATRERRIPWSLADQGPGRELPVVRTFLDLLALMESRFTAPEVLALCEGEPLRRRFGLDSALLPRLHAWVAETGIRWGLDEVHRREMEVDCGFAHSWRFGGNRLLLGHLMGACQKPFAGLMPYGPLGSGEAEQAGAFLQLIDTLATWRRQLAGSCPVEEWCRRLLVLIGEIFHPGDEDQGLATLRQAILALREDCRLAEYAAPISSTVLRRHLEEVLAAPDAGQPFLSGRVTFANMVPMRSVPFQVIWLMGMDDDAFPRIQHPPPFDLVAREPRPGDRSRRDDDRYLFLEALLSARSVFAVSWLGRSQRDHSLAPPSVVVGELSDYLDQACTPPRPGQTASAALTIIHPLQPFARACYDGTPGVASYNPAWLPAGRQNEPPPFLTRPLPPPGGPWQEVDLVLLRSFWRHPVDFFVRQILGLRPLETEATPLECEPFDLDGLTRFILLQETVQTLLDGHPTQEAEERFMASGRLPLGGFGPTAFSAIARESELFAAQLAPLLAEPRPAIEVDLRLDEFRLSGRLEHLFAPGRIIWRCGRLRGADLIPLFIDHLLLALLNPAGIAPRSTLLYRAESGRPPEQFILGAGADPEPLLIELLRLYGRGLREPLPFFPATSLAWAQAKEGRAEVEARQAWLGNEFSFVPGEGQEPSYGYFFTPGEFSPTPQFIELATLMTRVLELREEPDAAP